MEHTDQEEQKDGNYPELVDIEDNTHEQNNESVGIRPARLSMGLGAQFYMAFVLLRLPGWFIDFPYFRKQQIVIAKNVYIVPKEFFIVEFGLNFLKRTNMTF